MIWYFAADPRLSSTALAAIRLSLANGAPVFVSAISIGEMIYMVEKGKLPLGLFNKILLDSRSIVPSIAVIPFDLACAAEMANISRAIVPDMPDRMIAATALRWMTPLITKDQKIHQTNLQVIW